MQVPSPKKVLKVGATLYVVSILSDMIRGFTSVGVVETLSGWIHLRLPAFALFLAILAIILVRYVDSIPPRAVGLYSLGPLIVEAIAVPIIVKDGLIFKMQTVGLGLFLVRFSGAMLLVFGSLLFFYQHRASGDSRREVEA